MRKIKKGFTLVELMVVIALIGILGTMIATYVISSSNNAANIKNNYESLSEARIAMSYVTTLIRENDKKDAIDINTSNPTNFLVETRKSYDDGTEKDVKYEIQYRENKLLEVLTVDHSTRETEIARITSFDIHYIKDGKGNDTNEINITIGYKKDSKTPEKFLEQNITRRCLN